MALTQHTADRGRVLLVEDDRDVAGLIGELLAGDGFRCEHVGDDHSAYRRLTGTRYDLVVLDVNLGPGTTGFDVARAARRGLPDVGVIYVTGQATHQAFDAFGVPGGEFIEKPFDPELLLAAARRLARPPGA